MAKKHSTAKNIPFFKYLVIVIFLVMIITIGLFKFIDILPGEYFLIFCILLLGLGGIFSALILSRHGPKKRLIGTILGIIYIIILIFGIIYELNTINFLKKLGFKNYKTENYSIIVLKDSDIDSIEDLNNKKIASLDFTTEGLKSAKEKIEKKISPEFVTLPNINELKTNFLSKSFEGMLIENSLLAIMQEDDESFSKSYKVIYEFNLDVEVEDITTSVDITKDPFSIYITGIDTYGTVSSVARSDVNMVITVNPKTHNILITSIPRDYYVKLAGKNGKDKLTHAGVYGVETSTKTVSDLLNTNINYYIKVNFSSLIKMVDALDGVKVYSKYSFISKDGYYYQKGYNNVNGAKALSFVRERMAFSGGDRTRIENQANMVKAIFDKAISPSIIINYNDILKTLGNSFITNLDSEDITEFIKKQIDEMPSWNIENYSLNGKDSYEYTYTYGSQKLAVMLPDENTVETAQNKIKELVGEK